MSANKITVTIEASIGDGVLTLLIKDETGRVVSTRSQLIPVHIPVHVDKVDQILWGNRRAQESTSFRLVDPEGGRELSLDVSAMTSCTYESQVKR